MLCLLPSLLALVPHAAAPTLGFAGCCAAGLLLGHRREGASGGLRLFLVLLPALVLWGGVSILWSIGPSRSAILDLRLAGIVAAALALAAAAPLVAAPRRLFWCVFGGTLAGVAVAALNTATSGGITRHISVRPFDLPLLNQIAVWAAILVWPISARLLADRRPVLGAASVLVLGGAVCLLADTTAKFALAASVPVAAALYWRRLPVARIAAVLSLLAVLLAPLTLPKLAHLPGVFARADNFKVSAGHRLMIWSFVGDRIAERPVLGWGLDASRAIPGGKAEIRPGESWLPLHPHNAALQVWLELGAAGAVLFGLFLAALWWRIAGAAWPRLFASAAGGGLSAAELVAASGWGIWAEWWLATLAMALFAVLVMARAGPSESAAQ